MLFGVHGAVGRDGRELDLQKKLEQRGTAPSRRAQTDQFRLEIKIRRFAAVESRLRRPALLVVERQARKKLLGDTDFFACDPPVGFAQRPHDGECGIDELGPDRAETAPEQHRQQVVPRHAADDCAQHGTDDAAGDQAQQASNQDEQEHGRMIRKLAFLRWLAWLFLVFEYRWTCICSGTFDLRLRRQLQIKIQKHFATRCALAGDLLLSVATKVGKSAFYRRQLFDMLVGGVWGLGVRHGVSIADLLVRAACSALAYGR